MFKLIKNPDPRKKPPYGSRIDRSHPLAQGLVGCWLMNEGGGICLFDSVNNNTALFVSHTTSWEGNYVDFSTGINGADITYNQSLSFGGNDPITVFQIVNGSNVGNDDWSFSQGTEIVLRKNSSGYLEFVLNSFSSNDRVSSGASLLLGKPACIAGQYDGNELSIWENGKKKNSITPSGTYGNNTNNFSIGGKTGSTANTWNGTILLTLLYRHPANVESLYAEPYCFILVPQYWYIVDFGAVNGGTTTVQSDLTSLFDINNTIQSDLTALFDINSQTSTVTSDLTSLFNVYNIVQSDIALLFNISGSASTVTSDLTALFDIHNDTSIVGSDITLLFNIEGVISNNDNAPDWPWGQPPWGDIPWGIT